MHTPVLANKEEMMKVFQFVASEAHPTRVAEQKVDLLVPIFIVENDGGARAFNSGGLKAGTLPATTRTAVWDLVVAEIEELVAGLQFLPQNFWQERAAKEMAAFLAPFQS